MNVNARSMARLVALAGACLLWACSGGRPPPATPLSPGLAEQLPAGTTLAVARPTPGVARIALWIRAGSRRAEPPALATAAAFWAEAATGAAARVSPDATSFTLSCDTRGEGIERCVSRLARAFSLKAPAEPEARRLRERVKAARLRGLAHDARQVDLASLRALFGEAVSALDPLGSDAADERLTPQAIAGFLGAHYAVNQAVLIASGDVAADELAKAFAAARRSAGGSARRPVALVARDGFQLITGSRPLIAAALATPSRAHATELAVALRELYPKAELRVVPLSGQPLLTIRLAAPDAPTRRLEQLVYELRRLAAESSGQGTLRPDESLDGLVREMGESWAAEGPVAALTSPWPLGVALSLPEAEAPESPEAKKRAEQRDRDARAAITLGAERALGETEGDSDEARAAVEAPNGVRIVVERRPGDRWFAAALRFSPGSAGDPVTRHGRAALLATLLSDSCGGPWGVGLDERLAALDARIAPLVDAEGVGLSITAPREHTHEALDLMLTCALRPRLGQRSLEDARLRLLGTLNRAAGARFAAHLGQLLSPRSPGAIAPWGTPFGVSEVTLAELRRLHAESAQGVRTALWVAADGDPAELARFVSRRVSRLPRGELATSTLELGPPRPLGGELADVPSLEVVLGVRAERVPRATLASDVFARALRDALAKRLGRPLWASGASHAGGAAAGVALALRETELPALEQALRAALDELVSWPRERWQGALASERLQRAGALSSAVGWARAAFSGGLAPGEPLASELAVIEQLCRATPSYWILRPRP
jgi:predicted Zn-dependent peptidase